MKFKLITSWYINGEFHTKISTIENSLSYVAEWSSQEWVKTAQIGDHYATQGTEKLSSSVLIRIA